MPKFDSSENNALFSWRRLAFFAVVLIVLAPVIYRLFFTTDRVIAKNGQEILTIHYMAWGNPSQLETERVVIGRFNSLCQSQGKPLRVDLIMPPAGGYRQKLLLMLASGKAPDVARVDHYDFASIVAKGYVNDLTQIAKNDPTFHAEDFHPAAMRENYYHGHLYAMNMLLGGMLCYYNQNLFRAAGLEDPYQLWKKGQWTWAAFEDAAIRLTVRNASGRATTCGFSFGNVPPPVGSWAIWLWREGGNYLTPDHLHCILDSPESLRGFADMRAMTYTLHVAPTPDIAASSGFLFESGNIAMVFDFAGNTPRYRDTIRDFDWDICPTPSDPDNSYTLGKGNQIIMSQQCEHPQEAWEWIKYLTSKQTEEYFYGDEYRRCVPTRLAVLHDPQYLHAARPPFHIDVFVDVLDRARELPIDESFFTWTTTAQRYVDLLFLDPSVDLKQTMTRCTKAVDIDLRTEHERYARYAQER